MATNLSCKLRQSLKLVFCLIFVLSFECAAQQPKRDVLPRVGAIKDYEATGLATGCNNYYFDFPQRKKTLETRYVFLARSEGNDAWMNLNGRDVRLKQLRSASRHNQTTHRFKYRAGEISISVVIKYIEPKNDSTNEDGDYMFEAFITLRKGRAARTIKVFGHADC